MALNRNLFQAFLLLYTFYYNNRAVVYRNRAETRAGDADLRPPHRKCRARDKNLLQARSPAPLLTRTHRGTHNAAPVRSHTRAFTPSVHTYTSSRAFTPAHSHPRMHTRPLTAHTPRGRTEPSAHAPAPAGVLGHGTR